MDIEDKIKQGREFLRANWQLLEGFKSDQQLRQPAPELEKAVDESAQVIELPDPGGLDLGELRLIDAINRRESRRQYVTDAALSMEELSFLLWITQGVRQVPPSGKASLRTVPSGGARHSFETYLAVRRVGNLPPGVYRYLPFSHRLVFNGLPDEFDEAVTEGCFKQRCASQAAVVFVWTSIPYRAEWRYGPVSHKMIAIDAGHVCQNLYLGCEAIGCGTVAVGAYDQQSMDALVSVDGKNELVVYAAPVGRIE